MMQYEQWQSQPSCTLTKPRVRVVDSGCACDTSVSMSTHGPAVPATSGSDVVSGADQRRHCGAISSNCVASRFAAQSGDDHLRPVRLFAERTNCATSLRLARDPARVDDVQVGLVSGGSAGPASSSFARASIVSACETLQPRNFA